MESRGSILSRGIKHAAQRMFFEWDKLKEQEYNNLGQVSQSNVLGSATSASFESLLEIQILGPHPRTIFFSFIEA